MKIMAFLILSIFLFSSLAYSQENDDALHDPSDADSLANPYAVGEIDQQEEPQYPAGEESDLSIVDEEVPLEDY
ncbi:MAG: hypothetical protein NDI69_15080 [Bacteriovoracaceae bacterium]|nr:hypothetical protein [Bacteriovoracaceae bacterium]